MPFCPDTRKRTKRRPDWTGTL